MSKKKILGNIFSLGVLQLANYVFPFLTVPYLSRVLTTEHYGLILFSLSFSTYFSLLCDYGFSLSGTKEVAIHASNKPQLNSIVSNITYIKIVLFLFSIILNLIVVFSYSKFRAHWELYLVNILVLVNNVFFPVWFFQGVEKMKYITIIQVGVRILSLLLIFTLIHNDSQYFLWPVINVITSIISAIIAQFILLKYFAIRYTKPDFGIIKHQLKEGWHIFISTIAISLYTVSNSFFLGLLTNTVMVAYYASAEKIMNAIQGLLGPISQAFFPHLSRVVAEDKERGIKALQKALFLIAGIGLLISVILFFTAPLVVKLIYGAKYEIATTQALRVLAVLPFIICLSNVFGIQTMIPFGLSKPFSRILIISSCVNVLLLIVLIPRFTYIGTAVSVVITESLVTLMMLGYLHFNGIYIWFGKIDECKNFCSLP